jgi:hypothetical protein
MSSDEARMIWHTRCGSEMRRGQWMDVEYLVGAAEIRWWGCDLSRDNTSLMT